MRVWPPALGSRECVSAWRSSAENSTSSLRIAAQLSAPAFLREVRDAQQFVSASFGWIVHQKRLERSVHGDAGAIGIVNPAHLPELIHEEIHSWPCGADNRGQCVLIDFFQDGWCLTPLVVLPKPEQGAGQPLFAGIKNVAQQILFDMPVTFEQMLDELGCHGRLFLDQAFHGACFNKDYRGARQRLGGELAPRPAGQARFTKEIALPEKPHNGQAATFGNSCKFDQPLLNVMNARAGVAL